MEMGIQEILKMAGIYTLLGMGVVFAVLILISLVIWALGKAFKQEEPAAATSVAPTAAPAALAKNSSSSDADSEVVAVITAAINQFMRNQYGEEIDDGQYIVRNIRRATWKHIS